VTADGARQTGVYDDGGDGVELSEYAGEAGVSAAGDAQDAQAAGSDAAADDAATASDNEERLLAADERKTDKLSQNKRSYTFEFDVADLSTICLSHAAEGNVYVEVELRDEGHALYQSQGSVTLGRTSGGDGDAATASDAQQIVRLHPTGTVSSVRVSVDANRSYRLAVSFNKPIPLDFNLQRFLTLGLAALCVFAVRPASRLRRIRAGKGLYLALGAASCVFVVAYAYLRSASVSIDTTADSQYFDLARALAHGQLFLDEAPPDALAGLSNPYDTALRDAAGVSARWDTAYFQGRYYVYFGVLPVLLFHLPCYLLCGAAFPNWLATGLCVAAFACGVLFLVHASARLLGRELSCAGLLVAYVCVMAVSFTADAIRFPGIYAVPVAVGLALCAWGLAFWVRAVHVPPARARAGWVLAGSACMAAVVLARPQLLALSLLGPVLVVPALRRRQSASSRVRLLACALAPYALFLGLAACYNAARFGSPLDFGASYNLTNNDLVHRGFDVQRTLSGVFVYMFQLPQYSVTYPYIAGTDAAQGYFGTLSAERPVGGLLAFFPAVALAYLLLFSPRVRARLRKAGLLAPVALAGVLAVALAAFDANGGGLMERYYMDFGFCLGVGALLVLLAADVGGAPAGFVPGAALVPSASSARPTRPPAESASDAAAVPSPVEGARLSVEDAHLAGGAAMLRCVFLVAFAITLLDAVMWLGSSYSVFG
jgi:hypothetical protein